jgi:hypothetical protein
MALSPVAIDLDGALGDTRPLWDDFLVDAARRYASIAPLDPSALPKDRGAAAEELDRWAERGVGDWRGALERFAGDRAPVHFRPSADAATASARWPRQAAGSAFTDAPPPARGALAHLGPAAASSRRAGAGARRLSCGAGPGDRPRGEPR